MTAPLTSIVILTRNQLELTRACVASIRRCTPEPIELVFVDNCSTDGTVEWLRAQPDVAVLVENDRNLGFGGGCNQGIAASLGERVLLLNNDVVVTPGWLGALHDVLNASEQVGAVGPRSNRISGPQQVAGGVDYDEETLDGLDAFAARWSCGRTLDSTRHARLVGFCLLLERAVIDAVGGFDLRYGLGNFEDDDISLRIGLAGFELRVAERSFIHHFGSRTFTGEGIDYSASMGENLRRFATAWMVTGDEFDAAGGGYHPERILANWTFNPARHHAPLVATPPDGTQIELDARTHVVAVCCDRLDPNATGAALTAALETFGPDDDVTVAVRIDPRDDVAAVLLDVAADAVGDDRLPDVVVLERRDEDDLPLLTTVDAVVCSSGRTDRGRRLLARHAGVRPVSTRELDALRAQLRDAPGRRAA